MANRIVWFDVPVADLGRAMEFYSKVLDVNVEEAHGVGVLEHDGGKILQTKQDIGQHGFRTIVLDSEGNRIALHSE